MQNESPTSSQEDLTEVEFIERIARGSFGQLWKGRLKNQSFAIKVFDGRIHDCYQREVDIYKAINLRHPNVLKFIRNAIVDTLSSKTMANLTATCIFVEYHPSNSVFLFLEKSCVDEAQLIRMITSMASGLLHLHSQIITSTHFKNKEPMAHRDIKSHNILLKLDGSCAIADLGLAVIRDPNTGEVDVPTEKIAGTVRYMAPEILDESIPKKMVEAFQKADIYALALVMWEIATRCTLDLGRPEKYSKPYSANVGSEPTLETMHQIVCIDQTRPPIPDNRWIDIETLNTLSPIIRRCWSHNPTDRLTAHQLLAELQNIQQGIHNVQNMENRFDRILDKRVSIFSSAVKNSNGTFTSLDRVTIRVAKSLIKKGAELRIYGPEFEESEIMSSLINYIGADPSPELVRSRVSIYEDPYSATVGTDAIVVCTNTKEFVPLDYERIHDEMMKPAYIFDGHNILNHHELRRFGFIVETISNKLSLNVINRVWGSKTIS